MVVTYLPHMYGARNCPGFENNPIQAPNHHLSYLGGNADIKPLVGVTCRPAVDHIH
jgi:hypothetical protein